MAGLFGKVTEMATSMLADPARVDQVAGVAFGQFDKDKSGYVEGPEVTALVNTATKMLGVTVTDEQIAGVFGKFAGEDAKLDKEEFGRLLQSLIQKHGSAAAPAQ